MNTIVRYPYSVGLAFLLGLVPALFLALHSGGGYQAWQPPSLHTGRSASHNGWASDIAVNPGAVGDNKQTGIPIGDVQMLQMIGQSPNMPLDGGYFLTQDIDASETVGWNDGAGFAPIGDYGEASAFTGWFDGQGHSIHNLYINRPEASNVGLFGATGLSAQIFNVGLNDAEIHGAQYVGSLVGWNEGAVSYCYGKGYVTGYEAVVGGLVGRQNGTLYRAYSMVSVAGVAAVGGIAGQNSSEIFECYAAGPLSGDSDVGGAVGINEGNAYSLFWDIELSGVDVSAAGFPMMTSEMWTQETFSNVGWDFVEDWFMLPGGSYPFLQVHSPVLYIASMDYDPDWMLDGQWAWGMPSGGSGDYGAPNPGSGHTGDYVLGYNLEGDYPNDMLQTEWATTFPIDCSTAAEVHLSFHRWLGVENNEWDHAYLQVSNDGETWLTVWENDATSLPGGYWEKVQYDLTPWAAYAPNVYVRWGMGPTDGSVTYCGWSIDDVLLLKETPYPSGTVLVPSVINLGVAAAVTQIEAVGLQVGAILYVQDPEWTESEQVQEQEPQAGTLSLLGDTVTLWVTQPHAQEEVQVPNVVGMHIYDAEEAIYSAGLDIGGHHEGYNDTYPLGHIYQQIPTGDTMAYLGDPVDLWVSLGPLSTGIFIDSIEALQRIGNDPDYPLDGRYVLTQNIDASETANWNDGAGFVPIGRYDESKQSALPFSGVFDGQGHAISNLYINRPEEDYVGLFDAVGEDAVVQWIGLENSAVTGNQRVGGLVGINHGTISQCYVTGDVTGNFYVGGLVGANWDGTVSQCYAAGDVTGNFYVGGLVGANWDGTVSQSYVTSNVTGTEQVGGLVGSLLPGAIIASFWDIDSTGQPGSASGKGLRTDQMYTPSYFANAGWADSDWVMEEGNYPRLAWEGTGAPPIPEAEPIPLEGAGTASDPYRIETAANFALLSWHTAILDAYIVLANDIDCTNVTLYPIGELGPFNGAFDGQGHTISNVSIMMPHSSLVGLFAMLGAEGSIESLGVENAEIEGNWYVGGLVGRNSSGTVSQSYVTGSMTGTERVGGLVGENNSGTVSQSYATGSVSGIYYVGGLLGDNVMGTVSQNFATGAVTGNHYVGGLVGDNMVGTVSQNFATGAVTGIYYIGGLLGYNWRGTVSESYATGAVLGESYVGGLVGQHGEGEGAGEGESGIWRCYASGVVSGESNVGGLVGLSYDLVEASFWDVESSDTDISADGAGLPTAQMQQMITFTAADWDFAEVWGIDEGLSYPYLQAILPTGAVLVTLEPADAVSAGAQWRREGAAAWLDSGYTETAVPVGNQLITFKDISGWGTPPPQSITILGGVTAQLQASYTLYTGSLRVLLHPIEARIAGAQWRREGTTTWRNSGVTESALPVGDYRIEFRALEDWETPETLLVHILPDQTTQYETTYASLNGGLQVNLTPSEAITAGAQWRREGTETWFGSGDFELDLPQDDYMVEFRTIPGWHAPQPQNVTVLPGAVSELTATYEQQLGALRVDLFPAQVRLAGAGWRREGAEAWLESGLTEEAIPVGEYLVGFQVVSGWIAPEPVAVLIQANQTTQIEVTYVLIESGGIDVAPGGLYAESGGNAISLFWDPVVTPDLGGYAVYRRVVEAKEPFERITQSTATRYTDYAIETVLYEYFVVAEDRNGIEGPASEIVQVQGNSIRVAVPEESWALPGQTVRIPIILGNSRGLAADYMRFDLAFDPEVLVFQEAETTVLSQYLTMQAATPAPGLLRLETFSPESTVLGGEGRFVDLYFTVQPTAPENICTPFNLSNVQLWNTAGAPMLPTLIHGRFCVGDRTMLGDLNQNGALEENDVQMLLDIVVGKLARTAYHFMVGNLNGDKRLDSADAVILLRMVLGWGINPDKEQQYDLDALIAVKLRDKTVAAGTSFWLPITLSNIWGIAAGEILLSWPEGDLAFETARLAPEFADKSLTWDADTNAVFLTFVGVDAAEVDDEAVIAELRFRVLGAPTTSEQPAPWVQVNYAEFTLAYGESLSWFSDIALGAAKITIQEDPVEDLPVPDICGLPREDAEAAILAAGLQIGAISFENSVTVPEGQVIRQEPEANSLAAEGAPVNLILSDGPAKGGGCGCNVNANPDRALWGNLLLVVTLTLILGLAHPKAHWAEKTSMRHEKT